MYVVKMLLAAIVLGVAAAFGIMPRLTVVACMTAVVAVVLGSALLVSFLGVVGAMLGLTFITTLAFGRVVRATARLWRAAAIALLAASMLILWTQSDNQNYAVNTGTNILSSILSESGPPQLPGKIQAFSDSLQLLVKNTEIFLVGTGPGHFSSRAALLLSGAYLSNQPSFIPVSVSSYTEQIIIPMWNPAIWSVQFQDGVMNQPWNNVQSVLLETGLLGFSLYVLAFLYLFKLMINRPPWSAISGATRTIGLIVLCITPFVLLTDNWLEFPHAAVSILLPISIAASHKRAWATRRDTG